MRSFRIVFNQRAASVFAAAALIFATLIPSLAAADTVTGRSIALESSIKNASSVKYEVKFTVKAASTAAFALEFCDDPTVGTACNTTSLVGGGGAVGIDTSGVNGGTDTATAINTNTGVKVVLAGAKTAGQEVDVTLTGIHNPNPTTAGVFYARIITYTDGTAYTSNYVNPTTLGTYNDEGSVALSTTDGFKVSGRALETMVFCASSAAITEDDCSDATSPPNLSLGTNGILDTTASTGIVYTKISTNAVSGAVVRLKSDATSCGGLVRAGGSGDADAGCGITPIGTPAATISDGASKFGMVLTLTGLTVGTNWSTTNYSMDFASNNSTGVTSTYGSEVYNTGGAPVSNGTGNLTFGANIGNTTPAGDYSATLNLIATGKF